MDQDIMFTFKIDPERKRIYVKRSFNASKDIVWAAWTQSDILDQWWGPDPWKAVTKTMDFRPKGHWHYAMVGPDNDIHWSKVDFDRVVPGQYFSAHDGFSDAEGRPDPSMPRNKWENTFESKGERTVVDIVLTFDSVEDLDTILAMGFQEGFTMGLENLDRYLDSRKERF